eukprot:GEMP01063191.1.p1 GENE.GEMP01063191.1~~GEMP01063191.1.p1  ORF type:complete len:220 (+),score=43.08 GEMP01063191.1:150-809(+)
MPVPETLNDILGGEFEVPMQEAPCKEPVQCCFGCWCPCCAAYYQREQLLEITGEEYFCCGGACPYCGLDQPQSKVPCLCLETFCCPWLAITGNRYMVQTRFDKRNTPCDEFLIVFAVCCSNVVAILQCFVDIPQEVHMAKDILVATVQGCMHAQQQHEIDIIKKSGYGKPSAGILHALPPQQQMMIQQSKPANLYDSGPTVVGRPVQQNMNVNRFSGNK